MAFLPKKPGEEEQQSPFTLASSLNGVGSGVNPFAGGSAPAGAGTGGLSSYTNLQSYMDANPNDQTSANLVSNAFNKQIDPEKDALKNAYTQAMSGADSAAMKGKVDTKGIGEYGSYGQGQGGYFQPGKFLQDYISGNASPEEKKQYSFSNYSAPGYSYSPGSGFNTADSTAGNQDKFRSFRDQLYAEQAPAGMTTGMRALQQQLDAKNPALENARQKALGDIAGLKQQNQQQQTDYGTYDTGKKGEFNQYQTQYRNYLTGADTELGSEITAIQNRLAGQVPTQTPVQYPAGTRAVVSPGAVNASGPEADQQALAQKTAYKQAIQQLLGNQQGQPSNLDAYQQELSRIQAGNPIFAVDASGSMTSGPAFKSYNDRYNQLMQDYNHAKSIPGFSQSQLSAYEAQKQALDNWLKQTQQKYGYTA